MGTYYEAGKYEVQATSQGYVTASTGNQQFVLKVMVLGKVDPNDPNSLIPVPRQFERSIYRSLTEKNIENFRKDLETLGVDISSFSDLDPNNPNHISLAGKVFECWCNHENNLKGDQVEKWSVVWKSGGVESKPVESLDSSKVKALDRMFGRHLKKPGTPAAASASKPPVPVSTGGQEISDDDITF